MVDVILVAIDEPLVNSRPGKALVASAEAQSGSLLVGNSPLATVIAPVCLAKVAAEHCAELLNIILGWLGCGHTDVQQSKDVLNLRNKGVGIIGDLAKLVLYKHHTKLG